MSAVLTTKALEESAITNEHIQNNKSVRDMLGKRGIRPEELPPAEDIKKLERRVASEERKIEKAFQDSKRHRIGR